MDAERYRKTSPPLDQVIELERLATIHLNAYGDERSYVIGQCCRWILGEGARPCLAPHTHIDQEAH